MPSRRSCAPPLHSHGDGGQLVKIVVREPKGPARAVRRAAVGGAYSDIDSPGPRRLGRWRVSGNNSQVRGAPAAFFVLRRALIGNICLNVNAA
ncbi:MAG: hypothetical protein CR217_14435 [Beijerinckiaceae bacterium]|jgi:hypothetical protein|nr:MAG: hypothetical protein CR217_14435 [Beijerinckiaceae bacterium]